MDTQELNQLLPFLLPLVLIQLALLAVALFDLARRERTREPKWLWVVIILAVSMIEPLAYFLFGREEA